MKSSTSIASLLYLLSLAPRCLAGQKSQPTNVQIVHGPGSPSQTLTSNPSNSPKVSPELSPTVSLPPPVRRRDLAGLFYKRAPPTDGKSAGGKSAGGKSAGGKSAGGKSKKAGGGKSGGKPPPLSQQDIIGMINKGQKFPANLESAFRSSSLSKMFDRPKNLKPPPPELVGHPATDAIKILKQKNVPGPILDAAKSKWGKMKGGAGAESGTQKGGSKKGGAGAGGAGGAKAGAGAGGSSGKAGKAGKGMVKRSAEAMPELLDWEALETLEARDPSYLYDEDELEAFHVLATRDLDTLTRRDVEVLGDILGR